MHISSSTFHDKNLKLIETFLNKNNYPPSLTKKILYNNPQPIIRGISSISYFKLPYVRNISERVAKSLGGDNVKIAFSNANTIGKHFFTKQKSKTPSEIESNIVYKIPCKDCSKSYVGQTGRYLKQRLYEHRREEHKRNVINPTALVEHSRENNHHFDFENTTILKKEPYLSKRLLHEMIYIKQHNTVNYRRDIDNLNQAYFNIFSKFPT